LVAELSGEVRRRDLRALALFLPTSTLMLTVLAGPVSGGQRYSLALFMALPLAVAAALLARSSRSADRLEVTEPDALPRSAGVA